MYAILYLNTNETENLDEHLQKFADEKLPAHSASQHLRRAVPISIAFHPPRMIDGNTIEYNHVGTIAILCEIYVDL